MMLPSSPAAPGPTPAMGPPTATRAQRTGPTAPPQTAPTGRMGRTARTGPTARTGRMARMGPAAPMGPSPPRPIRLRPAPRDSAAGQITWSSAPRRAGAAATAQPAAGLRPVARLRPRAGFPGDQLGRAPDPAPPEPGEQSGAGDFIFAYPDPLWRDFPSGHLRGVTSGPTPTRPTATRTSSSPRRSSTTSRRATASTPPRSSRPATAGAATWPRWSAASSATASTRPCRWPPTGPTGSRRARLTSCTGDAAAWTFFGQADSHFTMQSYPGEYGDECRDFWVDTRGCDDADPFALAWGADGECVAYAGCSSDVRYCSTRSAAHARTTWPPRWTGLGARGA